jgi:hypothetical protein
LLQRFQKQPTAPTLYFIFDVLWTDGADTTDLSTAPAGLTGSVFDPEWFQVLVGNILAMDADPYNFTSKRQMERLEYGLQQRVSKRSTQ